MTKTVKVVETPLSLVFSTSELQLIANICSIDSLSIKFDWTQISGIHTGDGMVRVFFNDRGMWVMSIEQFKRLKDMAIAQAEFNKTLEFHAQSVIEKGKELDKVA